MTFYEFMGQFEEWNSPVGDLADDMYKYEGFPVQKDGDEYYDTYIAILGYLIKLHAVKNAIRTFDRCWNFYEMLEINKRKDGLTKRWRYRTADYEFKSRMGEAQNRYVRKFHRIDDVDDMNWDGMNEAYNEMANIEKAYIEKDAYYSKTHPKNFPESEDVETFYRAYRAITDGDESYWG